MPTLRSSVSGQGFPVVFIHGFCETRDMWFPWVEALNRSYTIICPDLPGYGETPLNTQAITLESVADDLVDHLTGQGITEAVLIGHSLGGYIALALAERHPGLIRGLGLFHSTAFADDEEARRRRDKALRFLQKHPASKFIETFIPSLFYDRRREELSKAIQRATRMGLTTPTATVIAYTQAMRDRKDRFGLWKDLACPRLFIAGMEDPRIPVSISKQHLEGRGKVDGHILAETAHMGVYERPLETLQMIRDYLAKVIQTA